MTNKNNFPRIRIFYAVPNETDEERKCLDTTIKELCEPGGVIEREGVELEVAAWSRFLEPYMKKSKTVNLDELPLEEWDLFVGILRFRFDVSVTAANGTDKSSITNYGTETKEVFEYAYNAWKRTGCPHVMFYRSHRSFSSESIDIHQIKHIQNFFNQFVNNYQRLPLYKVFKNTAYFGKILVNDLLYYVKEFKRYQLLSKQIETIERKIYSGKAPEEKPGQSEEMVFLRVDSLLHNPILNDQPLEKIGLLVNNYRDFAAGIIAGYKGFQIYGGVDGSVWAFWGDKAPDRAVSAGIEIVKNQNNFNVDKNFNPIGKPLKLRLAAHCEAVDIGSSDEYPYLRCKNYVTHLEKYNTLSGTFAVTEMLYQKLSNNLKKSLKYERNYEYDVIYSYAGPYEKEPVTNTELENIYIKIEDYTAILSENIRISTALSNVTPDYADMRWYIQRIYKNYEYLYRRASDYEKGWSEEYFNRMIKFINSILNKEERLHEELIDLPVKIRQKGEPNPTLLSIRYFVGSSRIYSMSNLDLLLRQFKKIPGKGVDIDNILEEYMREKIVDFVYADDFHEETAFAELFLNLPLKEKLKAFVETQHEDPLYEELVLRFWRLADFVRIEDRNAHQNQKIFPILTRDRKKGNYFKVVEQLLLKDLNPERSQLERLFSECGIPLEYVKDIDTDVVLKCLLIDHVRPEIRQYVINNIQFKELWNIIAYSKTPLDTIKEIAQRFLLLKDEDRMKVFFDLTLLRLINDLFNPKIFDFLPQIKTIVEIFFKFDFFIEASYFRRLNDLTLRFKEKVGYDEIGILEESMKQLEKEYTETGGLPTREPHRLNELPKAVQKKLACDGHYLEFFCTSTDNQTANEVERYVNYSNIGRFVSITAINGRLLNRLLRKDELFKFPGIIYAALCNPKCNLDFAVRHASKVSRTDLKKIAFNPNVNSEIKKYIKNKLKTR